MLAFSKSSIMVFGIVCGAGASIALRTQPNNASGETRPALQQSVDIDLKSADPRRFINCEGRSTKIKQMACNAGATAQGAVTLLAGKAEPHYFEAFAAIEAANIVQAVVGSARYWYMMHISRSPLPVGVEQTASQWSGICGNHIETFLAIMQELGIKARPIQYYYTDATAIRNSHIAAEVYYSNRWNYFDVTWNAVFPTKMALLFQSHSEVLSAVDPVPFVDNVNVWTFESRLLGKDPFEYIKTKPLSVIVGGVGTVKVPAPASVSYTEDLHDLPYYVGDNLQDGEHKGINYRIALEGRWEVKANISATAGCSDPDGDRIAIGRRALPMDKRAATAVVDGPFEISIETKKDVCYAVLKNIGFKRLDPVEQGSDIVTGSISKK